MIRSKRVHRFLAIAPFVAVVGVVVFYWGVNRWGQAKIDATCERLQKSGIPLALKQPTAQPTISDTALRFYKDARATVFPRTVFETGGLTHPTAWNDFITGTSSHPPGDLRIMIASPGYDQTEEMLAEQILDSLRTTREAADSIIEAIRLPEATVGRGVREQRLVLETAHYTGWFSLIHSILLMKAGDLDGAVRDFQLTIQIGLTWQSPYLPNRSVGEWLVHEANRVTPFLIEAARERPKHLQKLDQSLASVDSILPTLRAEQMRLHHLCKTCSELDGITNDTLRYSFEDLPWAGNSSDWRQLVREYWWQTQPIGYRKANLAKDIDSLIPIIQGLPEVATPNTTTFADLDSYEFHSDPRTNSFAASAGAWQWIPDSVGHKMVTLLNLRFHRLSIAAELHRHRTGSYPETIHQLMPKPLISPFDGEPIRLAPLPDGRLRFEAAGATLLPDGTLHFDPTTPITFDYPPKP
ncbi:hypothetical protein [Haloferula sp. A504]|uniref:hypothetical protein n=1 Tax=Haloferula sp. A504 TaxID=3373601 RepID=UPI0031C4D627|nr:hypothetical protein [Verrucomicrobiaceae bacterium E54]